MPPPDLDKLVMPHPDDYEGAEQEPTKRHAWSRAKVQTKPTRAERREIERADRQAPRS